MQPLDYISQRGIIVHKRNNVVDVPFAIVVPRHTFEKAFLDVELKVLNGATKILDGALSLLRVDAEKGASNPSPNNM